MLIDNARSQQSMSKTLGDTKTLDAPQCGQLTSIDTNQGRVPQHVLQHRNETVHVQTGIQKTESLRVCQIGDDIERIALDPVSHIDSLTSIRHFGHTLIEELQAFVHVWF